MTRRVHSADVRAICVNMYHHGMGSLRKIARVTNTSKTSVHRWLACHPVTRHQVRTTKRKVTTEVREAICRTVDNHPFVTLQGVVQAVRDQCSVALSDTSIRCVLRSEGFTRRRTFARAPDEPLRHQQRAAFQSAVKEARILADEIISVDETCFYLHMRPRCGRARKGRRLSIPVHHRRHHKMTVILAICSSGILHWEVFPGSANTASFAAFVQRIPTLPHHRVLLMDNVSFHTTALVYDAVRDLGLTPLHTPPYTPEWNPVEHAFSVIKAAYKKRRVRCDDVRSPADIIEGALEECIADKQATYDPERTFLHCWRMVADGRVQTSWFGKLDVAAAAPVASADQ